MIGPESGVMRHSLSTAIRCDPQLRMICQAACLDSQTEQIVSLFRTLCELGNIAQLPLPPRWSGVTDDCTPIEFSIAIGHGRPRVRLLVEAQDDPPSPSGYWKAGERLSSHFAEKWGADLRRLRAIEDLFVPTHSNCFLAAWHSVEFDADRPPLFKIYLNVNAHGTLYSRNVISRTLERLGFADALPGVMSLCGDRDMFTHLSLDLSSGRHARLKVYVRHFDARPAELASRAERAGIQGAADFETVCRIICGDPPPLWKRPVMTCYHLLAKDPKRPTHVTLYVPLFPYARDDRDAHARISGLLRAFDLPTDAYSQAVSLLTQNCATASDGLHTYVSYQRSGADPQVGVYFNPRVYHDDYGRLALDPDRFWPSPVA